MHTLQAAAAALPHAAPDSLATRPSPLQPFHTHNAAVSRRTGSTAGGLSLGASGAVYACFALTALLHPDASAVLIFLPMVPIAMGTLLQLTMGLDMLGVVLGWQALDHWGHLGGASFGVWYTLQGHRLWQERHKLLGVLGGDEKERGKR